jgi:hypothetical protein
MARRIVNGHFELYSGFTEQDDMGISGSAPDCHSAGEFSLSSDKWNVVGMGIAPWLALE